MRQFMCLGWCEKLFWSASNGANRFCPKCAAKRDRVSRQTGLAGYSAHSIDRRVKFTGEGK